MSTNRDPCKEAVNIIATLGCYAKLDDDDYAYCTHALEKIGNCPQYI